MGKVARTATTRKKLIMVSALFTVVVLAIIGYEYRLPARLLHNFSEWRHAEKYKAQSIWLPDYRVVLEAIPVKGIEKNLSGLTWNNDTKTLFAVINNPVQIAELSTTGELLRRIDLSGFGDPEAIEYIGDNRYIVADERGQKIILVFIDSETREIDSQGLPMLTIGLDLTENKGIEGLAWDFSNKKLYAARERDPVHIYEIIGFPQTPKTVLDIEIVNDRERDRRLFVRDVSSLDFNQEYQHLLVLSDESRIVIEVDKKGRPISSLSLIAGQGLRRSVPQAEGIAMDDRQNLYLVSEPNLFYVFQKKSDQ